MGTLGLGTRRRIALGIAVVATVAFGIGLAGSGVARGATTNRAAVVVEVDGVIHTAKITFSTDSINGIDALRDAGFAPTVRVFGGQGGAVCALDVGGSTIGCPADNTCLTCSPASEYWAYWRALAGATSYTYSPAAASATQVRDGDVEAWNWGTGAAPSPFVSFTDVWGATPTTTRPRATTPTTGPPATSPPTVGTLSVTPPTTTPPSESGASTSTTAHASTTTTRVRATTSSRPTETSVRAADGSPRKVATAPVVARGGGGSPWGLVGFVAILVVLFVAILVARGRRRAAPANS